MSAWFTRWLRIPRLIRAGRSARAWTTVTAMLFGADLVPSVRSAEPPDAAAAVPSVTREITLDQFLREVIAANLDYAAQRYSVDLAKADAAAAHLWPNPVLGLGASRDLTFHNTAAPAAGGNLVAQRLPESRSVGLTQSLDLIGKRRWRIRSAEATYRAAAATLEDFLRNLKLDAAGGFAEALAAKATVEQQRKAAGYLAELAQAQHLRWEKGDLSEADYLESRLEQLQFQNDLRESEAAAAAAELALNTFLGMDAARTRLIPQGELNQPAADYDLARLVADALTSRPDLAALRHTREAAQSGVSSAKADRFPEVDVNATYAHSTASQNFIAPSPSFNQLQVGVSLPLPLWNRNQYEIRKALANIGQAQRQLESAELKAEVQIRTAYGRYRSATDRLQEFQGELLRGADTVLSARRYSYEHGQTSLLEVLEAQRTANDIQQSYHDALADATKARIELLRAAGSADIAF